MLCCFKKCIHAQSCLSYFTEDRSGETNLNLNKNPEVFVRYLLFRCQRITEILIRDVIKIIGMGSNQLEKENPYR